MINLRNIYLGPYGDKSKQKLKELRPGFNKKCTKLNRGKIDFISHVLAQTMFEHQLPNLFIKNGDVYVKSDKINKSIKIIDIPLDQYFSIRVGMGLYVKCYIKSIDQNPIKIYINTSVPTLKNKLDKDKYFRSYICRYIESEMLGVPYYTLLQYNVDGVLNHYELLDRIRIKNTNFDDCYDCYDHDNQDYISDNSNNNNESSDG